MAFKQRIPEDWIKQRPNIARMPHFYNIDAAVGMECPNRTQDVMLVQVMLRDYFETKAFYFGGRHSLKGFGMGDFPTTGVYDNRTLAWILFFQMILFKNETSKMNGKILPIRQDGSDLNGDSALAQLNFLMAWPKLNGTNGATVSKEFQDLASAAGVPASLASAIRMAR